MRGALAHLSRRNQRRAGNARPASAVVRTERQPTRLGSEGECSAEAHRQASVGRGPTDRQVRIQAAAVTQVRPNTSGCGQANAAANVMCPAPEGGESQERCECMGSNAGTQRSRVAIL